MAASDITGRVTLSCAREAVPEPRLSERVGLREAKELAQEWDENPGFLNLSSELIYMHTLYPHTYMHIYMHTHMSTYSHTPSTHTHTYTCMSTHAYKHTYMHIYI